MYGVFLSVHSRPLFPYEKRLINKARKLSAAFLTNSTCLVHFSSLFQYNLIVHKLFLFSN